MVGWTGNTVSGWLRVASAASGRNSLAVLVLVDGHDELYLVCNIHLRDKDKIQLKRCLFSPER